MSEWKFQPARDLDLGEGERLRSVRRENGLFGAMTHAVRWKVVRLYLHWIHRLQVEGREHLPTELPCVLVANHSSHLDALVLSSVLPIGMNRAVFPVAAGDAFFQSTASAALVAVFLNALPMARDGSGGGPLRALRERMLEEPCGFVLFPEGTRSRTGEMARFKAGIGMLVAETAVPVVPGYLEGAHAAWPPHRRVPRARPLRLRLGPPLRFSETGNQREGWRAIAAELEAAVTALKPGSKID